MHAWLNSVPEKAKQTRLDSMGGRYHMPPVSPYERSLIELLFDAGPVTAMPMGGYVGLSESEVGWYRMNRGARLSAYECKTIRRLSRVYAAMLNEASKTDCPVPWTPVDTETRDKVGKQVAAVFAGLRRAAG